MQKFSNMLLSLKYAFMCNINFYIALYLSLLPKSSTFFIPDKLHTLNKNM